MPGTVIVEVGDHKVFYGISITVDGCHCLGMKSGPVRYFTEPALLLLAGTVMGEVGPIRYFTEPAFLWMAGTLMGEVEPIIYSMEPALLWFVGMFMGDVETHKIFHGASICVVGLARLWERS